jgi:hypothetical protein
MADYPTTPQAASTPHTPAHASPDPAHIAQLLTALDGVPRAELPDGPDRDVLAQLIRWGMVDNLYTPMGADYHNIAWANRPAWADPRERISDWLAERRHFDATGQLTGLRAELAACEGYGDA